MGLGNGLMRLFWPSDAPNDKIPGVIIGWRNSDYDAFVVAILLGVEVWPTAVPFCGAF